MNNFKIQIIVRVETIRFHLFTAYTFESDRSA